MKCLENGKRLDIYSFDTTAKSFSLQTVVSLEDREAAFDVRDLELTQDDTLAFKVVDANTLQISNQGGEQFYGVILRSSTAIHSPFLLRGNILIGDHCVHRIIADEQGLDTALVSILVDCDGDGVFQDTLLVGHQKCGDVTGDDIINVGDVVFLISYLYRGGAAPSPIEVGDVNCDGIVNVGDVVFLITYLYRGGPSPSCY
jgi:hypothetical protein